MTSPPNACAVSRTRWASPTLADREAVSAPQFWKECVMGWKLRRVNQCDKCPWRVDVDPHDIPNGYSEARHRDLSCTIAEPGSLRPTGSAMSCHEHTSDEQAHCVGWLAHQLGPGNNLPLRIQMMSCENRGAIRLHGEQHARFEDTLP